MGKKGHKPGVGHCENSDKGAETAISKLRQDADLWYRIRVLIHDLSNLGSDPSAEKRLSATTHELYISAPYFTESEALKIRTTPVDNTTEATTTEDQCMSSLKDTSSLEEAIHQRLANFFEKRRASGDSRPCGPHDMVPIYVSALGIAKEELKDERFLSRLKKSGLGDSKSPKKGAASHLDKICIGGQKKGTQGKKKVRSSENNAVGL